MRPQAQADERSAASTLSLARTANARYTLEMMMWTWLKSLFEHEHAPTLGVAAGEKWTPETVEQRIELAGRAEVFAEARRLGWGPGSMPPMWVWGAIANDIIARKVPEPNTLH